MDPHYHAVPSQYGSKQPLQWTAVNRQTYTDDRSLDPSQRTTPSTLPAGIIPFTDAMHSPYAFPPSDMTQLNPVQALPQPQHILKSQSSPKACLVCGRMGCPLQSHKYFANESQMKAKGKAKSKARDEIQGDDESATPLISQSHPLSHEEEILRYPMTMDHERHRLLALWSQEWGLRKRGPQRHLFPVRWIDLMLPHARQHAPLFQALLATSAFMWALANNSRDDSSSQQFQLAIRLLTAACVDQKSAGSDECMLGIVLITFVYLTQGNAFEVERHHRNLVHAVEFRGGAHYLGISGILADLLLYVDHLQAILFDRRPSFEMHLPALEMGLPPKLGGGFRELLTLDVLSIDLLMAADSLGRTTDIFALADASKTTASGAMNSFGYLSTISEYQLARCNVMFHGSNTWNECICLALLLFNHVVLRNEGVIAATTHKIEFRLWLTIEATLSHGGFGDIPPCLLLWVLFTGLVPCLLDDSKYKATAIEKMRASRIAAAIHGWDHCKAKVLDDFIWLPAAQEDIYRDIWLEVEGYKLSSRARNEG